MAKAVISGYYGFKNYGDEAILSVLTTHLKSLNIEPVVLSSDVEYTSKNYSVDAVNRFDLKKVFNVIKSSDILISGGGSLLQDVTSLKSLVYYIFIIFLGVILNKKTIIFAQGVGPINNKFAAIIVKHILKLCSYVSVRDENSLKLLKKWGVDADLVCDPVFSYAPLDVVKERTIGIQLRDFSTMNLNLLQKLAMLINEKYSDYKVCIFSLQYSQDYDLSKRFESILKNINSNIQTEIVTEKITEKLSSLEFLIGMRFHALLVSIKSGVKCCAINYDIKVENLAKAIGIPLISMDAHENFEEIYAQLENLDSKKLSEFANSQQFDWTNFDKTISIFFK